MRKFIFPITKKEPNGKVSIKIRNPFYKNLKIKALIVLTLAGALCALIYIGFFNLYAWVKTHEVIRQNPVIVRAPIIIKEIKEKLVSPKPTQKEIEAMERVLAEQKRNATIERIYQYTRFMESRLGFDETFDSTHVYCQSINKVNEIGYFLNGNKKYCFANEAEQKKTFINWLNNKLDGGDFTLNEALCLYVSGERMPTCKRALELGL